MEDCLFCKIARKEIPSHQVYEDAHTLAFLDINQNAPGHTLVIPKKHGLSILDFEEDELAPVFFTVKKVAHKIESAFTTDSLTIGINHKEESGVHHLHVHVIPRYKGDKGGSIQSIVNNPATEPLEKLAEKIRTA